MDARSNFNCSRSSTGNRFCWTLQVFKFVPVSSFKAREDVSITNNFSSWYGYMCRRNKELVKELSIPPDGSNDLYFESQYAESTWGQFKYCLWKKWWSYWRNPAHNLVRFFFTLVTGLLMGTIFWGFGKKR